MGQCAEKTVMLGSSSKFRAKLVENALPAGFKLHETRLSPDIDEKAIRRADAQEMVMAIANAKMDRLFEMLEAMGEEERPDFVIAADQVIVFDGVAREKPVDEKQAKEHLQSYGLEKKPAECTSGVVVANWKTKKRSVGVDVAVQHFKEIPDDVALALIKKGDVMYCAGSFVVEDPLLQPYIGVREGEIESVQGMPLKLTQKLLLEVAAE